MDKIAVMGDYDSIYGFAALGLSIFPVGEDIEKAAKTLRSLAENDFGIIYMTEALAQSLGKEIARYESQVRPAIILIPGVTGNTGEAVRAVKGSVEKAVGSDILFGDM